MNQYFWHRDGVEIPIMLKCNLVSTYRTQAILSKIKTHVNAIFFQHPEICDYQ